jgi:hypothetical protein
MKHICLKVCCDESAVTSAAKTLRDLGLEESSECITILLNLGRDVPSMRPDFFLSGRT